MMFSQYVENFIALFCYDNQFDWRKCFKQFLIFSTEQSSPSTLSTSSNSGRRIHRANRNMHPHTKINRLRHHRNHVTKAQNALNGNGGMIMLKNGIVLSPSQLMVLKEGHQNGSSSTMSSFPNSDNPNNQLTVVVVENRSSEISGKNGNIKNKRSENNPKMGDKYSESTTPANSTSSSSSSSPSNLRFSKPSSNPNNVWCDKLHR